MNLEDGNADLSAYMDKMTSDSEYQMLSIQLLEKAKMLISEATQVLKSDGESVQDILKCRGYLSLEPSGQSDTTESSHFGSLFGTDPGLEDLKLILMSLTKSSLADVRLSAINVLLFIGHLYQSHTN